METPVTSLGRRSGVNWIRLKEQPLERARLRASIVLPTPGTSSTSRWPAHIKVIVASTWGGAQAPTPTTTATPITTATSTPRPKPTPTPTPMPTPTPVPPSVALPVAYAKQGGFLRVQLLHPPAGTKAAVALFNGGSYPMVPDGDAWSGIIGMATDFPLGVYAVEVTADGVS